MYLDPHIQRVNLIDKQILRLQILLQLARVRHTLLAFHQRFYVDVLETSEVLLLDLEHGYDFSV